MSELSSHQTFWEWFREHHADYRAITEEDREEKFDRLMRALHVVHEELWFQISLPKDGICDLVITAEGNRSLFPEVDELISVAPEIPGWTFTALKPADGMAVTIRFADMTFDPTTMWFKALGVENDPDVFGLRVAMKGMKDLEEDSAISAVAILLESCLGERRMALWVDFLDVEELPDDPAAEKYRSLAKLPEFFDQHFG